MDACGFSIAFVVLSLTSTLSARQASGAGATGIYGQIMKSSPLPVGLFC